VYLLNRVKANYKSPLAYYKIAFFLKDYMDSKTIVVCIGTDRCIGDCLGPIVGSMLKAKHFPLPVYGTTDEPIHALNIDKRLDEIEKLNPGKNIIGIDACLGDKNSIGEIQVRDYAVHPGKGVGKSLPDVGRTSIIGIVDANDNKEIFNSNNIRLDLILKMSNVITLSLLQAYYMSNELDLHL
jgi:putative sporulation protein YyaC